MSQSRSRNILKIAHMLRTASLLGLFLVVIVPASCLPEGLNGGQSRKAAIKLERIQKEINFKIRLPKYLPAGFAMTDANKWPFGSDQPNPAVRILFVNQRDDSIKITEWYRPFPVESTQEGVEDKVVKGVRVEVLRGSFTRRSLPDGGLENLEGVAADWWHNDIAFHITTSGVFWDEVEKIIASMIE